MRRSQRILVIALAAVIVASGLSFGLVKAYAQDEPALGPITPAELLTKVLDSGSTPTAVSGDIAVKNELLGSFPVEFGRGGGSGPAALLQSGGGRLWVQGEKARMDAQGAFNDTVLYWDGEEVTIYDSTANKLTVYALPASPPTGATEPGGGIDSATFNPQVAIPQMIERLAPIATLAVSGPEKVAGRDCHILTLTPTAPNTLFGSLRVAVDGQTYLPLQVAVFAKGGAEPVFLAGFTSISYDPIDDSIFEVPSPAGAQIEQKQLQWPSDRPNAEANTAPSGTGEGTKSTHAGHEPLTIEEASAEAGFTVLAAQTSDPAYAFQGAYVLDLPKGALDIATDMGSGAVSGLAGIVDGPVVVLVYGQGFGTVLMVQAETASIPPEALQSLQTGFPFLQTTDVNGTTALRFGTPLMSLLAWQQEASTVIVAGSLSAADLTAFAASVR